VGKLQKEGKEMWVYKVYADGELIGALPEKRAEFSMAQGLRWAEDLFKPLVGFDKGIGVERVAVDDCN
jgi:hypothetical protein